MNSYDREDDSPLLALIRQTRDERDAAAMRLRILLAMGRECKGSRPYPLQVLATAAGMSPSGVRTAYSDTDVKAARDLVAQIKHENEMT